MRLVKYYLHSSPSYRGQNAGPIPLSHPFRPIDRKVGEDLVHADGGGFLGPLVARPIARPKVVRIHGNALVPLWHWAAACMVGAELGARMRSPIETLQTSAPQSSCELEESELVNHQSLHHLRYAGPRGSFALQ